MGDTHTTADSGPRVVLSYAINAETASKELSDELNLGANAFADAIRNAGGQPVIVDAAHDERDAASIIEHASALVVLGGADMDPELYGQQLLGEGSYGINKRVDAFEIALTRAALDRQIPFLGVCRGMQLLNVACGGTLHQDLGSSSFHKAPTGLHSLTRHPVRIETSSIAARVFPGESIEICSGHHQAVDTVGAGLRATAFASDGVIEAIESPDSWTLGIQWHPELQAVDHESLHALAVALVAAARASDRANNSSPTASAAI